VAGEGGGALSGLLDDEFKKKNPAHLLDCAEYAYDVLNQRLKKLCKICTYYIDLF
jgi:hypothetical protein